MGLVELTSSILMRLPHSVIIYLKVSLWLWSSTWPPDRSDLSSIGRGGSSWYLKEKKNPVFTIVFAASLPWLE